jgi:hypothetical protein
MCELKQQVVMELMRRVLTLCKFVHNLINTWGVRSDVLLGALVFSSTPPIYSAGMCKSVIAHRHEPLYFPSTLGRKAWHRTHTVPIAHVSGEHLTLDPRMTCTACRYLEIEHKNHLHFYLKSENSKVDSLKLKA